MYERKCIPTKSNKRNKRTISWKHSHEASHQPNQDYYVNKMDNMSYAKFICPENKKEILDELERALEPKGQTCFFRSK